MVNEHTLKVQKTMPVMYTCADGTAITKGTVLKFADPNTVSASTGAIDIVAGIAYTDKIANDGVTKIAVLEGPGDRLIGIASGAITVGDPLITAVAAVASSNYLSSGKGGIGATGGVLSGSLILGTALETAAAGETFLYKLNII